MFDHVGLRVKDVKKAARLYKAMLAPLGHVPSVIDKAYAGFGPKGKPALWLVLDKRKAGAHLALRAPSRAAVDKFYKKGRKAGAKDNGKPGLRPRLLAQVLRGVPHRSRRQQRRGRLPEVAVQRCLGRRRRPLPACWIDSCAWGMRKGDMNDSAGNLGILRHLDTNEVLLIGGRGRGRLAARLRGALAAEPGGRGRAAAPAAADPAPGPDPQAVHRRRRVRRAGAHRARADLAEFPRDRRQRGPGARLRVQGLRQQPGRGGW